MTSSGSPRGHMRPFSQETASIHRIRSSPSVQLAKRLSTFGCSAVEALHPQPNLHQSFFRLRLPSSRTVRERECQTCVATSARNLVRPQTIIGGWMSSKPKADGDAEHELRRAMRAALGGGTAAVVATVSSEGVPATALCTWVVAGGSSNVAI